MLDHQTMAKIVASLDREGAGICNEPELGMLSELLRARLGNGVLRWMLGAVQDALATLNEQIVDPLASRVKFRVLSQHILTNTLLELAEEGSFPTSYRVIDREIVSDFVARDISLPVIVRAFRHVQREWLDRLICASLAFDSDANRLISELVNSVIETIDAWVAVLIDAMVQERRRITQTDQLRLRATIETLISGTPLDSTITSAILRRPLTGWHTCCVISALEGDIVDRQKVDASELLLSRLTNRSAALRYETSSGKTYFWITTEHNPLSLSVSMFGIAAPLVAGVGEPHRGIEGFRRTYIEADDALHLALRTETGGGLNHREVALAITLSQHDERARWFVESELGALVGNSTELAEMRQTLRVFFATKMRIAPAAERLFIHRNTLIRRLERIEKLIGHPLSERNAEIQAALTIADLCVPTSLMRSSGAEPPV